MKTLFAMAVCTVPLLATRVAFAQSGNMMNGGAGSGCMGGCGQGVGSVYGGISGCRLRLSSRSSAWWHGPSCRSGNERRRLAYSCRFTLRVLLHGSSPVAERSGDLP